MGVPPPREKHRKLDLEVPKILSKFTAILCSFICSLRVAPGTTAKVSKFQLKVRANLPRHGSLAATVISLFIKLSKASNLVCRLTLVLHDTMFLATCVAIQVTGRLQRVIRHLCNLSGNFFMLATIEQS